MEWRHGTWQCARCRFKLGCCEGEPQTAGEAGRRKRAPAEPVESGQDAPSPYCSERERDLRQAVGPVEVAAAQLGEADRCQLARDHRRQRAQPLRHARRRAASARRPGASTSSRSAITRRAHRARRGRGSPPPCSRAPGPDGATAITGQPGGDRRDRAVHQVGGRVRLEEQARRARGSSTRSRTTSRS